MKYLNMYSYSKQKIYILYMWFLGVYLTFYIGVIDKGGTNMCILHSIP